MTLEVPGAPASNPQAIPPAPAPAAAAPPVKPVVTVDDLPPEALKERIAQAKHSAQTELLASWGVTDPAQVKAYIDAAKSAEEAKKTDTQKLAEQGLRLTNLESAVDSAIAQAAATLTPERKAAIDAVAGTDKALWLKIYGLEKKPADAATGATPPPSGATGATGAPPPAPPPSAAGAAGTAPAAPAPSPNGNGPTSPPDHPAIYQKLLKTNPFAAPAYLSKHGDACFAKQ